MLQKSICALSLLLLLAVSACGPSGGEHGGGHGAFGMHHLAAPLMHRALRMGLRSERPRGFRRACEEDAAKLCPSLARRQQRDCLQGKRTMLGADCREALDKRLERTNKHNNEHTN